MRKLIFALTLLANSAFAQQTFVPTRPTNDNSNAAASTAYVSNQITSQAPGVAPVQSVFGRTGSVVSATGDYSVSQLGTIAANTIVGNFSGSTTNPGVASLTTCTYGLTYSTSTFLFGCAAQPVSGVTVGAGLYASQSNPAPVLQLADRHTDGRLTLTSATPVMTSTVSAQTTLYYAPYIGNLISIYNGTLLQNYQFTSSASDTVGLSLALGSNWAANSAFDVFAWLNSGSPALCTVPWTNLTTRATALAIYNGILTNSGTPTCRYSNSSTTTLAVNQGTYLGSFYTNGSTGQVDYNFGGSSSGGTAASLAVWNYYNRVNVQAQVKDSGGSYTYSSNVTRQARGSAGNQVVFLNGVVEDAIVANYTSGIYTTANTGSYTNFGIGLNTTTAFTGVSSNCVTNANAAQGCQTSSTTTLLPLLGQQIVSANEQGDNSHLNTIDLSSTNTLVVILRQ